LLRQDFWSDLNRLRLEFDAQVSERVHVKAVVDNELLLGSLLGKPEFVLAKNREDNTLFDLDYIVKDDEDLYWEISLYRLYFSYSVDDTAIITGRQRIAWGTARLWNPTDLFNPISPLQIDRDARAGVDAINIEHYFNALSSVNLVYALGNDNRDRDLAIQATTNVAGYDLSALIGEFREDWVVGLDFAGNLGNSGFRGETTFTDPEIGEDFTRVVMSWDYSFPNTLYLLLEYLYNGGNLSIPDISGGMPVQSDIRTFARGIVTRNKNFLGWVAGYEVTPLFRVDSLLIYDIDDRSVFWGPAFKYNIFTNLDWSLGVQIFSGETGSEFGDLPGTFYSSLEWFF